MPLFAANRFEGRNKPFQFFPDKHFENHIAALKHRFTTSQSSRQDRLRQERRYKDNPKGTSAPWLLTGPGTVISVVEQPQNPYRRVKGGYKGIASLAKVSFRAASYIMGHHSRKDERLRLFQYLISRSLRADAKLRQRTWQI